MVSGIKLSLLYYTIGLVVVVWLYMNDPRITDREFLKRQASSVAEQNYDFLNADIIDFEGFNNEEANETDPIIVPNIIHLIYMEATQLRFHEMICLYSIYLNQRPAAIVIHCENCSFHGKYWRKVEKVKGLRKLIHFNQLPIQRDIFGQQGHWPVFHRGDYWRNLILMEYGGIYLDNDVFVVHSLDYYRKFEMSVGFENMETYTMGSQVLVAHKNARLLKAWFDTYRSDYRKEEWYYNAGGLPGKIIEKCKYIAHQEPLRFGVHIGTYDLYLNYFEEWNTTFDTWHLLMNHRDYLDEQNYKKYPEFDEKVILIHNVTFSAMARDILARIWLEIQN